MPREEPLTTEEIELQQITNRLTTRIKQINLSLKTIQYELDTTNTLLNAIQEDLKQGES